jgi:tetratricopeptide (TPR) repeat protein
VADWPRLRHYRTYLRGLSKRDGLLAEMEFAPHLSHMLIWDYANPDILELRFEDLIADEVNGFVKIFAFLGLLPHKVTLEQVQAITGKYSFRNLSQGRPAGQEDPYSHFRKGQAGDWRNHFEPMHIDYFKKLYNPLLLKLGYEIDEDWTKQPHPAQVTAANPHQQGLRLFREGKYEEATQLFRQALVENESAERWNDWATAQWSCGRPELAKAGYQQALRLDANCTEAALNLGIVQSHSGGAAAAVHSHERKVM